MADLKPLSHLDADKKDDATLRREAEAHFAKSPGVQIVGELLCKLRSRALPWWSPEELRVFWNATERMRWLRERPDLREQITASLTGLPPSAARKKTPEFQGGLLDSFLEDGDVTLRQFEDAFDPIDLAVYGPATAIWRKFRERFPWDQDTAPNQEIVAFLLRALLADKSTQRSASRRPVLSPWEVRTAIPSAAWHARIPLDIRIAVDEARLQREKSGEPFGTAHELTIATPEVIAASVPLRELTCLLDLAQAAMGCDGGGAIGSTTATPTVVDPMLRDPEDLLASISRRAINTTASPTRAKTTSSPPAGKPRTHVSSGYIAVAKPEPVKSPQLWPEDDGDEEFAVVDRFREEEQTQPRAQALGR